MEASGAAGGHGCGNARSSSNNTDLMNMSSVMYTSEVRKTEPPFWTRKKFMIPYYAAAVAAGIGTGVVTYTINKVKFGCWRALYASIGLIFQGINDTKTANLSDRLLQESGVTTVRYATIDKTVQQNIAQSTKQPGYTCEEELKRSRYACRVLADEQGFDPNTIKVLKRQCDDMHRTLEINRKTCNKDWHLGPREHGAGLSWCVDPCRSEKEVDSRPVVGTDAPSTSDVATEYTIPATITTPTTTVAEATAEVTLSPTLEPEIDKRCNESPWKYALYGVLVTSGLVIGYHGVKWVYNKYWAKKTNDSKEHVAMKDISRA